jgi:putrescine transport system substrate-binding protein
LLAGSSGYDIVVPSAGFMERQIQAGVFRKLDKTTLKNYSNLDTEILQRVAAHDPGNEHAVPYMWGTTGIGYNINKVKELMPNAPVDSWAMLFDPNVVSKLSACGRRKAVRRAADESPAAHQVLPLVAEHQRFGERRDLRRHGLERRHAHRPRPRR